MRSIGPPSSFVLRFLLKISSLFSRCSLIATNIRVRSRVSIAEPLYLLHSSKDVSFFRSRSTSSHHSFFLNSDLIFLTFSFLRYSVLYSDSVVKKYVGFHVAYSDPSSPLRAQLISGNFPAVWIIYSLAPLSET